MPSSAAIRRPDDCRDADHGGGCPDDRLRRASHSTFASGSGSGQLTSSRRDNACCRRSSNGGHASSACRLRRLPKIPTLKVAVATFKLERNDESRLPARPRRGHRSRARGQARRPRSVRRARGEPMPRARCSPLAVGATPDWPVEARVLPRHDGTGSAYVSIASGVFQFASAPLTVQHRDLGIAAARPRRSTAATRRSCRRCPAPRRSSPRAIEWLRATLPADLVKALTPAIAAHLPRTSNLVLADVRVRRQAPVPGG